MKKFLLLVLVLLMLTGCGAQTVFETVDDLPVSGTTAEAKELLLSLPKEAASPVMQGDDGACLYDCGAYTLTTQVLPAGDLNGTLEKITGFTGENLSHMKTRQQNLDRYDCVWTCAGEGSDLVGRGVVLDDGAYHYAVTVMTDAQQAGELLSQWNTLLSSVKLSTD